MVRRIGAALCFSVVLSAAAGVDGGAHAAAPVVAKSKPSLTSHMAMYELSLVRTKPGDGVRAARGTMTYTLADRCEGYTIESNVSMKLSFGGGDTQDVDQRYAAWESKDGRSSTFSMQTVENGKTAKTYRGAITLNADGSGTATYDTDKPTTFDLPPGTMLSTSHTLMLLEKAATGTKFFSGRVIDGSFDRGPFVITALISAGREAKAVEMGGDLSAGRYWPMSLAYFPAESKESTPEYELGMDILSSGISRAMVQDFGDFAIGFKLIALEPLKPGC